MSFIYSKSGRRVSYNNIVTVKQQLCIAMKDSSYTSTVRECRGLSSLFFQPVTAQKLDCHEGSSGISSKAKDSFSTNSFSQVHKLLLKDFTLFYHVRQIWREEFTSKTHFQQNKSQVQMTAMRFKPITTQFVSEHSTIQPNWQNG